MLESETRGERLGTFFRRRRRSGSQALRWRIDAALGKFLPVLLAELHATYVRDLTHRREALVGLIYAYRSAASVCHNLGVEGWPLVAALRAQTCAEELGTPEWIGFTAYVRGIFMVGAQGRQHQYTLSVRATGQLQGSLADPNALQVAGTLHLNAALACAVQGNAERMRDHLAEAEDLAGRLPEQRENVGGLYFGADNVGLWRVSLGTELGEGAKVAEYASGMHPEAIPVKGWQALFYVDLGRSLASEQPTREQGIHALFKAESIAPSSSVTTCSPGNVWRTCFGVPGGTRAAGSFAAWPGGWVSPLLGEDRLCVSRKDTYALCLFPASLLPVADPVPR